MKRIGAAVSILLLLIGGTYAGDNISDTAAGDNTSIVRKDFEHRLSNDTNTSTDYINNGVDVIVGEDTNRSSVKEKNVVFGDAEAIQTEKKSSPGFGPIATMIVFLSLVVMIRRVMIRRR